FLLAADEPTGQGQLADYRGDLHSDAQAADQTRGGARSIEFFRLGVSQRRPAGGAARLRSDARQCRQIGRAELAADQGSGWKAGVDRAGVIGVTYPDPKAAMAGLVWGFWCQPV